MKNTKTEPGKMLLIGIGNCGRGDDGLGWMFADYVREHASSLFDVEYRYQLQVEDAELISQYDTVIFADASHEELVNGFEFRSCEAAGHFYYSSHMQSPQTLLFLSEKLFGKKPDSFIVGITGVEWDLKTSLHPDAEKNLHTATDFFENEFLLSDNALFAAEDNDIVQ
jgi:hydrogenase maturation protease